MIIAEASAHDEQIALAEELMDKEQYGAAAEEATKVLEELEPTLPTIAQAALTKGRALMTRVLTDMSEKGELPPKEIFDNIWEAYQLSKKLNPECDVTKDEMTKVSHLLREIPPPNPSWESKADYDVLVVGAGCAGVGTALMLTKTFGIDKSRVVMIERGDQVGDTFRKWPAEMRFISPSFNQQGWTNSFDLNSISNGTSPAYSLHSEHPSGIEYASYLSAIVKTHKLNVRTQTEVVEIEDVSTNKAPLFSVHIRSSKGEEEQKSSLHATGSQQVTARYIVWAAGEFQYPKANMSTQKLSLAEEEKKSDEKDDGSDPKVLPGSEHCIHNSQVRSWATLPGDDFVIIGGYESGVDACYNLSKAGKKCTVMASTPCWSVKTADPSAELAPYTAARLREVLAPGFSPRPKLNAPLRVLRVDKNDEEGGFDVTAEWKEEEATPHAPLRDLVHSAPTEKTGEAGTNFVVHTKYPPILCTGFEGSVAAMASDLFEFASGKDEEKKKGCMEGAPLLTDEDESTVVPGVFLVGPTVSHGKLSFCFVYKFRQRFAIVANKICQGLGMDTKAAIEECRKSNMYLDEFSCCGDTCGDVC